VDEVPSRRGKTKTGQRSAGTPQRRATGSRRGEPTDEPEILEGLARDIVSRLATTLFGADEAVVGEGSSAAGPAGPVDEPDDGPARDRLETELSPPAPGAGGGVRPLPEAAGGAGPQLRRAGGSHDRVESEFGAVRTPYFPVPRARPAGTDRPALLVRGTVRSGRQIRHNGDVIVLGDVNPGAQIVAAGDIVVMGTLRGMVHAGATGDHTACAAAFRLAPTQLRIASYLARPPEEPGGHPEYPEVALVRDGVVIVRPLHSGTFPGLGPTAFRAGRP